MALVKFTASVKLPGHLVWGPGLLSIAFGFTVTVNVKAEPAHVSGIVPDTGVTV